MGGYVEMVHKGQYGQLSVGVNNHTKRKKTKEKGDTFWFSA
jgi:hypothetical protein